MQRLTIRFIMKKITLVFAIVSLITACGKKENSQQEADNIATLDTLTYQSFGTEITTDNALSKEEMLVQYQSLSVGDTLQVKFASEIKKTCKKKGCWMTLDLSNEKQAFIKFKDYAFFVPKEGAEQHRTIVSGKAFVSETSVEDLKHYAKDAGKTEEEIETITEPKVEYGFMADGVLIAENN